jgi:hypothetical protein
MWYRRPHSGNTRQLIFNRSIHHPPLLLLLLLLNYLRVRENSGFT